MEHSILVLSLLSLKKKWFSNTRNDLLSGTLVALALIPEAIAFSIIAGVDPKVGLYASCCIAVVIAFVGGRSAMISAATGAMALVMVTLVKDHGLNYLFAATILTGLLQIIAGLLKFGSLMRFVSRSVVTGFVNALAILIFMAQLPEFRNAGLPFFGLLALGLAIIYIVPRYIRSIPSPLICIVVLTFISIFFKLNLRTVGDMGQLPSTLPVFLIPSIPFNLETLTIIFPYAVTLTAVGLLESLMTATIVDDLTHTSSSKSRECTGQGIANVVCGFFGGMAGCGMIGQTVINVKTGGRSRLSTLWAGLFLLFLILVMAKWVRQIPMAALVAVMTMVSIGTFNWSSLKNIKTNPKSSTLVMLTTVMTVVFTHNLAIGVLVGVLMSALFFSKKVEKLMQVTNLFSDDRKEVTYKVTGQIFFASAERFAAGFNFNKSYDKVIIDVSHAHFWDLSAVEAIDKVVLKFQKAGAIVQLTGMNEASSTIVDQLSIHKDTELFDAKVKAV